MLCLQWAIHWAQLSVMKFSPGSTHQGFNRGGGGSVKLCTKFTGWQNITYEAISVSPSGLNLLAQWQLQWCRSLEGLEHPDKAVKERDNRRCYYSSKYTATAVGAESVLNEESVNSQLSIQSPWWEEGRGGGRPTDCSSFLPDVSTQPSLEMGRVWKQI